MHYLFRISLFAALILASAFAGNSKDDAVTFREISVMKPSNQKIEALQKFKNNFPESELINRANQELFRTYLGINNADSALYYAHIYLESLPVASRMNAYNGTAYQLAEAGIGLDSALVYADRALELTKGNARYLNNIKDTKAYVLYKSGNPQSALDIQKEAIKGYEQHPEFLYHLALYNEAVGNTEAAIKNAGMAVLYGDPGEAMAKLEEWIKKTDPNKKDEIIMGVVSDFISNSERENKLSAKSDAAAFMAQTNVDLELSDKWAEEAIKTINNNTKVEEYVSYQTNYAIVKAAERNFTEALKYLEEVKNLVDPWNGKFWLTLGKVYEKLNQRDKALESYASGLIVIENPPVLKAAKSIASENEIKEAVEKMEQEIRSFEPGKFDMSTKETEKVVLAELFTGAECNPCAAADIAFDELAEYYPRNALAILEYHVHIPGPDPLTNPETYQRYGWYGANFGTPTVFFEGTERIIGGGPRIGAFNRFNVYNHAIKKYFKNSPNVEISGNAKLTGNKIDISLTVKPGAEINPNIKPALFIAVTEKSVNYTGGNGVDKHIFVVRDLVNGPAGTEITLKDEMNPNKTVDVSELEQVITEYLTDPTTDASWTAPQFTGWRLKVEELNSIDEKNLAIVAWVQDAETKEVIQAHYFDVR